VGKHGLIFLLGVMLTACSSSNSGPKRPSSALDTESPLVLTSVPLVGDERISTQSTIFFEFNEQLKFDDVSLAEGVTFSVLDDLLINFGSNEGDDDDQDGSLSDKFFREREASLVTDTKIVTDTDPISQLPFEKNVTTFRFSGRDNNRFALNTEYQIKLAPPLKDLSTVDSVNPITNEKDTGNFLPEFTYEFVTEKGIWGSAEALVESISVVGQPKFVSLANESFAVFKGIRTIPGTTTQRVGLYALAFDNQFERWGESAFVLDDLPTKDNDNYSEDVEDPNDYFISTIGDVDEFNVAADENTIFVIYTQALSSAPATENSVLTRVYKNGEWQKKLQVSSTSNTSPLSAPKLALNKEGDAYAYWLAEAGASGEKQPRLSHILLADNKAGVESINQSEKLPSVLRTNTVDTAAQVLRALPGSRTLLLVSVDKGAGYVIDAYVAGADLTWSPVTNLSSSGVGVSFDFGMSINDAGTGFAYWLQRDFSVLNLYTSRFDGSAWAPPQLMEVDDRGDVLFPSCISVNDGHAILLWVSDASGFKALNSRTFIFSDNEDNRNFSEQRVLFSRLSESIDNVSLKSDYEGNAHAVIELSSGDLRSFEYSDNELNSQAWSEGPGLNTGIGPATASSLTAIAQDGRMAALWITADSGEFRLGSAIFTEDLTRF
jgi:hypothetical protein